MVLFPSAYPERPCGTVGTSSLGVSLGFGGFLMQINMISNSLLPQRTPAGNPP
jgi:hypothetical protein